MSKKGKKVDGRQLNIFDLIVSAGDTDVDRCGTMRVIDELRSALAESLRRCSLSRHQVAGEMSHLLNEEISKAALDSWTAESKLDRHIPAEFIPAFCKATGSNLPLEVLIRKTGLFALEGPEALRSEIHKYSEQICRLRKEVRKREQLLGLYKCDAARGG